MQNVDYNRVLADLRERRDKLNAAIAAIEEMSLGTGGLDSGGDSDTAAGDESPIQMPQRISTARYGLLSDSFFQMSAADAAKKYLRIVKRPAGTKEICDALTRGGYLTNAKNFYSNLYTTLLRTPDVIKVKKEWGLAEWYPGKRMERSGEDKEGG